ncbi:MAG: hypothetical protein J6D03_03595 [Clostridia bacterium]|nr:hypothetical protein [Clostridia bacterium]
MRKAVNEVKKAVKEMKGLSSDIFEKVDTKKMASQVATATKKAKKQLESLGLADIGDTSSMKINGIGRQITGISNKFKQLKGQRGVLGDVFDAQRFKQQADEINKSTNRVKESISNFKNYNSNDIQGFINNYTTKTGTVKKSKIDVNTADIKKAKAEVEKLNSNINKTNNNKIKVGTSKELQKSNTFANRLKNAIQQVKKQMDSSGSSSKKISNGLSSAKSMASKMGGSLKVGLGQILKISGALFGLQTIYSTLTNVANTWLSSQNTQAKQLSANIDYMKYALGSTLAPVIQWIVNLIYQALKGVQSLIYALTGVNIFANASAKAYSNMAGSAKKAKEETKQLSGIHSEIDNIQDNNNSDSGNGVGDVAPNIDLSNIDGKLIPWAEKVKGVLSKLFEPMRNAWANHGQALMDSIRNSAGKIKELFGAVGKSFAEVWLNGTGERICSTILQIITTISDTIGIMAEKWKNAWEKDNNGTQIIQNLADAFSNVLDIVLSVYDAYKEWWKTEQAQNFVNAIVQGFEIISSVIEKATEIIKNIWEGAGRDTFTSLLDAVSKAIEFIVVLCDTLEPFVTSMMEAVAPAIELIVKLIGDWLGIIGGLLDFWIGVFTGDWSRAWEGIKTTVGNELEFIKDFIRLAYEFIVGIPGKIAEKVTKAAEELGRKVGEKITEIRDNFVNKFNEMKDKAKEKVEEIKTNVVNKFIEMKDKAVNKVTEIKEGIRNKFQEAYDGIKGIFRNIGSFFSGVWDNVKRTFSTLGTNIGNAISNAVKSGINGVISMIQNTINRAIGLINGAIRLINKLPGVSIGTISTLSLPRLAKGGVLYDETAFIGGEYSGARSNPEIVSPKKLMYETMVEAISDSNFSMGNKGQPIRVQLIVGTKMFIDEIVDGINEKTRRTGKAVIKVGD